MFCQRMTTLKYQCFIVVNLSLFIVKKKKDFCLNVGLSNIHVFTKNHHFKDLV